MNKHLVTFVSSACIHLSLSARLGFPVSSLVLLVLVCHALVSHGEVAAMLLCSHLDKD